MTDINKQKFLAELGKLLTFMYEEDRLTALAMYNRMFDEAEDEMALLQLLGSPTRQAVIVARAYNAKERKLQVTSQSRDAVSAADEGAAFVQAIHLIRETAITQRILAPEVTSGQISLFEDDDREQTWIYSYEEPSAAPQSSPAPPFPAAEPAEEPASAEMPVLPAEETGAAFAGDSALPESEEPALPQEEGAEALAAAGTGEEAGEPADEPQPEPPLLQLEDEEADKPADIHGTVRKPRIFLLIVYILFAVPLTLIGIVLLLVPTLLTLGLAGTSIALGVGAFTSAFGGFAVLADILVVLGAALMILALGLLFLWLFIWFIGGAIAGLVRGVIELGNSWCFKEVPAA